MTVCIQTLQLKVFPFIQVKMRRTHKINLQTRAFSLLEITKKTKLPREVLQIATLAKYMKILIRLSLIRIKGLNFSIN